MTGKEQGMDWKEQDWDDSYNALEAAVSAIRRAQRTMLDRDLAYEVKVEEVGPDLHCVRRHLDSCAAAMERTDAEARAYELVAA